jgi:hypothetical protein
MYRISHYRRWLQLACWVALGALFLCARSWDKLPWETWQTRMMYLLGGLAVALVVFSLGVVRGRIPLALGGAVMFGLELARAGEVTDLNSLRHSSVMVWGYVIALGLLYDQATVRRRSLPPAQVNVPQMASKLEGDS